MEEPTQHFVSDFHGVTTLHPLGLAAVLVLGTAMLLVPRRYSVWPMIVMACFIAPAQRIVVAGADFDLLRMMVLFGLVRVLLRGEWRGFRWHRLDWTLVAFAAASVAIVVVQGRPDMLMNRLGYAFDALGMYLLFRMLIRGWDDVKVLILGFTLVSFPVAGLLFVEHSTGRNLFSVLGGVPEITPIRQGRLRCQGAFAHPILAGLFWASVLPLVALQWWDGRIRKMLAVAGVAACLAIVVLSASAAPLTAVAFAVVGAVAFFIRHWMRWVRWGGVITLFVLHMVMNAPVWHLISRLDVVQGNSSYHRYLLIDGAIRHWHEWWLVGSNVGSAHWGSYTHDVTNTYVVLALRGGLPLLITFVVLIAMAFRAVGYTWRRVATNRDELRTSWALGVCLFVHVASFIAISYFGQIVMVWYLLLATIGSMAAITPPVRGWVAAPSTLPPPGRRPAVASVGQLYD